MAGELRKKALHGLGWTFSHQLGVQLIKFSVSILLARLLTPDMFGIIGIITVVMNLGTVIIQGGLSYSLIRTENPDEVDYSTVFLMNMAVSLVIYAIILAGAPLLAAYFHQPALIGPIRVYGISLVVSALSMVQQTRLTKTMAFKTLMVVALPSLLIGGIVGIICAWYGLGVWSLVWMNLTQTAINTVLLWVRSDWRPSVIFSKAKFLHHLVFGYRLTLSALLFTGYKNLVSVLIGRYFSAAQLGFYTRAQTMKQLPVDSLSEALNKVTFPLFASIQNDDVQLRSAYQKLMKQVLFWVCPVMVFSGVLGEPLFRFLLTEKWLPAVPYFQILCITGIMYPIHAYNLNILNVKGRSDLFFRLEIIKVTVGIVFIFIGLQYGIYGLLVAEVLLDFFAFLVNTHYSGRFIQYTALQQLKDIAPTFALGILAGAGVYFTDYTLSHQHDLLRLMLAGGAGATVYFGMAHLLRMDAWNDFREVIRSRA